MRVALMLPLPEYPADVWGGRESAVLYELPFVPGRGDVVELRAGTRPSEAKRFRVVERVAVIEAGVEASAVVYLSKVREEG